MNQHTAIAATTPAGNPDIIGKWHEFRVAMKAFDKASADQDAAYEAYKATAPEYPQALKDLLGDKNVDDSIEKAEISAGAFERLGDTTKAEQWCQRARDIRRLHDDWKAKDKSAGKAAGFDDDDEAGMPALEKWEALGREIVDLPGTTPADMACKLDALAHQYAIDHGGYKGCNQLNPDDCHEREAIFTLWAELSAYLPEGEQA